jgi:pimeloyl-ACP methyl ester carboxylesterase
MVERMREEPLVVPGRLGALRGMQHAPSGTPKWVVLVLQGYFSSTHVGPARLYVQLARQLQHAGCQVLRMDPFGVGDSDGDFTGTTYDTQLDDYFRILTHARLAWPNARLALLGHSLGANLALKVAAEDRSIERLVLISPTVGPISYPEKLFTADERVVLSRGGNIERHATLITAAFMNAMQSDDAFVQATKCPRGATIFHAANDEYLDGSGARRLAAALPESRLFVVPEADHNHLADFRRAEFLALFDREVTRRWA